ncbi:nickel-dependent lactate racemase [Aminivibrio sp.]|jgi:nickel-dependent lactate racemase|uniref:nickel-dependent lactate racemase n=1 Tax=Aminivibrio sp. TaxID=1872489 RepID=UPI003D9A022D
MNFTMKYGKGTLEFQLEDSKILQVVLPPESDMKPCTVQDVDAALDTPVGTPSLSELLKSKKPKNVVMIVNDITRPTPYDLLLPPVLKRFADAGITDDMVTLLVATGIHDPHTPEQNLQVYGDEMVRRFRIVSHVSDDLDSLAPVGMLSTGSELRINRLVRDADFVLTLGVVMPHYFAGYSGGRKSIFPGVAWKQNVERNHSRMVQLMDDLPDLDHNPVSLEMIEAAKMAGVDMILNVVVNENREIVKVVAGDVVDAWKEAVAASASLYEVPIKGLADVAIASACGHPRDINVYQAQKALDHADKATKKGGAIILLADCPAGYGESVFEQWMNAATCPGDIVERIQTDFMMGGHKAFGIAKVAAEKTVYMVTSLDENLVKKLFFVKVPTIGEALRRIEAEKGSSLQYIVMPEGGLTVPVPEKG